MNSFIKNRLEYYQDFQQNYLDKKSFTNNLSDDETKNFYNEIAKLEKLNPKIIILTSSKNRFHFLKDIHNCINSIKWFDNFARVVIDNNSTDETSKYFNNLKNNRVFHFNYRDKTWYAAPVRNFWLDILQLAFKNSHNDDRYIYILDSDDKIYDEYSLYELLKLTKSRISRKLWYIFHHWFTINEYYDENNNFEWNWTHPHDIDSNFPKVDKLKDVYDYWLTTLSSIIPYDVLTSIKYPDERSFEDNWFTHKLYLYATKTNKKINSVLYPVTIKRFHNESMANINNWLPKYSEENFIQIWEHKVFWGRVDIVKNLQYLRDFFTRELLWIIK